MAKRKAVSLQRYFERSLFLVAAGTVVIIAAGVLMFLGAMRLGIMYPANAAETAARMEIERVNETGSFDISAETFLYDYVSFDKDGAVVASSFDDDTLIKEVALHADRTLAYADAEYVSLEEGRSILFVWSYKVLFANAALRSLLPDATVVFVVLTLVVLVVFYVLLARAITRRLSKRLALVEAASGQIASQDLESPIVASSGIKEFDRSLQSMEDMREALKESLTQQWESEQKRKEEIAALAHDIKTPLTIINGNAELLMEDALSEEHGQLVQAIHEAGVKSRHYVSALQETSRADLVNEELKELKPGSLMDDVLATLEPLTYAKGITLNLVLADTQPLCGYSFILTRALVNIGENAMRFTPQKGSIDLIVKQTPTATTFVFEDEGPGFSAEAIKHAHEMLWQEDKSRTSRENSGMGLAIAAKAAALHQGTLSLSNTKKGGQVCLTVSNGLDALSRKSS